MSEYRVGIVPAAGKATRFGGTLKELLPISNGMSLLKHSVMQVKPYVDDVMVVSSRNKIQAHVNELGPSVIYAIQREDKDIWGAMKEGYRIEGDYYFFTMADTLVRGGFPNDLKADFYLGTFQTMTPERFGCFTEGYIVNKSLFIKKPAIAWGTLIWSSVVFGWWMTKDIEDYTQAINMAIDEFGYETYELESYTDFASFEDYKNFLKGEPHEPINT